ncbi:MAG: aminotransferase [Gemmatales bacterium]|nr:MAG: aminotransferase [Gemmatales bacterium]
MKSFPHPERIAALKPTAVNRVLEEVRSLQRDGKKLVSLMRGQPDSSTPGHIVEAAIAALGAGRTGYADNRGEPALREAVAEKLHRSHGLRYDPAEEILITDGATLGVYIALGALLSSGDEVIVPAPIYDAYEAVILLWGGVPRFVPGEIDQGRFSLDPRKLEAACTPKTRLLLLNSPWNPVGSVLAKTEIEHLADLAERFNLVIISDEIYDSLVYDGRRHLTPAALCRDRTVVVNSLSKTYAMTGWRVGYCAGPEPIIRSMFLLLQQSSRGPATFVQDAASAALQGDQTCVEYMRQEFQRRRDFVVAQLEGIDGVRTLVPEGGLFVMLDVRGLGRTSDEIRRFLLHDAGVVVLHGSAYGEAGEGMLRVSFAAGGDTLEQGVALLKAGLEKLSQTPSASPISPQPR